MENGLSPLIGVSLSVPLTLRVKNTTGRSLMSGRITVTVRKYKTGHNIKYRPPVQVLINVTHTLGYVKEKRKKRL